MAEHLQISKTLLPDESHFDSEEASKRVREMFARRGSTRGPELMIVNDAADQDIDESYAYRVSDLKDLLPPDLWVRVSYWGLDLPEPGQRLPAGANALAARIRLHYCEIAREERGDDNPQLKTAIIKERAAVRAFRDLGEFYRRKGFIE